MSVIPQFVNNEWIQQYDAGGELLEKYGFSHLADHIIKLAEEDRKFINTYCRGLSGLFREDGQKPLYLATAGAPLAGKSTILDQVISQNHKRYGGMGKADPDVWGMRLMTNLYHGFLMSPGMVASAPDFQTAQQRAYDIARPASNYIANDNINKFVKFGVSFAHGTTMTSPHAGGLLQSIKDAGYEIDLLLCGAEDDMRADAAEYRSSEQGLYQATAEDVVSKGLAFAERMSTYFEKADNLQIFWRDGVTEHAVLAATFSNGQIDVHDMSAYERFTNKYEEDCLKLARPENGEKPVHLPEFETHEAAYIKRFQGGLISAKAGLPSPTQG